MAKSDEIDREALAEEIYGTQWNEADVRAAKVFLKRFQYSTTALGAIWVALQEADAEYQATELGGFLEQFAAAEALER